MRNWIIGDRRIQLRAEYTSSRSSIQNPLVATFKKCFVRMNFFSGNKLFTYCWNAMHSYTGKVFWHDISQIDCLEWMLYNLERTEFVDFIKFWYDAVSVTLRNITPGAIDYYLSSFTNNEPFRYLWWLNKLLWCNKQHKQHFLVYLVSRFGDCTLLYSMLYF